MAHIKELHLCKSIDDLDKLYRLSGLSGKKLDLLYEIAIKMHKQAVKYEIEGDQELTYVNYMKYLNLVEQLRTMKEYKTKNIEEIMKKQYLTKLCDKLENLKKSLEIRYANRNSDRDRVPLFSEDSRKDLKKNSNNLTFTTDDLIEQMKIENVLIMDCRSEAEYESSRIIYKWCFNVPEHIIKDGLSAGKIQEQLNNNSKKLWAARLNKEIVVLMDTRSRHPLQGTAIWQLKQIFKSYDPDINFNSIKILEGGYEDFSTKYPMKCTKPTNILGNVPIVNNILDELEYPLICDITMKEDVNIDSYRYKRQTKNSPPNIDRSSKPAAENFYKKKLISMLNEKENLAEKVLKTKQELLKAECERNQTQKENRLPIGEAKQRNSREFELNNNIMQLETKVDDIKIERNEINQELKELQKENEFSKEEMEIATAIYNYESSCEREKKIDDELKKEKQTRENLQFAKEQKRHLEVSSEEDDKISKPKMPQFDRSIKPIKKNNIPPVIERIVHRDFSPVRGNVTRGLTGLKNLGNTCYMNSILQCLSNTNSLTDYLITNQYKRDINRSNKTRGQIVEELAALIRVLWKGHYKCVASKELRHVIGQYKQIFCGIEQQDSHEFLTILMDWLHSDLQTLENPKIPSDGLPPSQKAWLEFTKSQESLILRLFYGQIKSTVKCCECRKESATYECFSNISLELPSSANQCELLNCMEMYFAGERIQGWICPDCKQPRQAIKKLNISKLPPILVIHLKRFYADSDFIGQSYKKKQSYVRFPLENLNMSPYATKSELRLNSSKTYNLYGVSNHYGNMESGHYTAFCKSSVNGKWIKFDDQVVTEFDQSNVESSAAYILFYTSLPLKVPAEVI